MDVAVFSVVPSGSVYLVDDCELSINRVRIVSGVGIGRILNKVEVRNCVQFLDEE